MKTVIKWFDVNTHLPKNMDRVLIAYKTDFGSHAVTIGWYVREKSVKSQVFEGNCDDEYDESTDEYYLKEQWVDESVESEYYYPIRNVTHWAMMPDAPGLIG